MKRTLYLALAITITLSLILACGPKAAPPPAPAPTQVEPPSPVKTAPPAAPTKPAEKPKVKLPTAAEEFSGEYAVPQAWIDGAKKEGKLSVASTIDPIEFQKVASVFQIRYPFIKEIDFVKASHEVRAVKPLVEYKMGRVQFDLIHGLGGEMQNWKAEKALVDISDLPLWKIYPTDTDAYVDPQGHWIGFKADYWGIGYNTNLVKREELPEKWEDIINPKWGNKAIGLGNRPQLWAIQLWKYWGPEKTKVFLKDLFGLKPQLRKEGMNAMVTLLASGEYKMNFPAGHYRVKAMADKGGPVAWYSPEPLLVSMDQLCVLKGSPNPNAARLFANWQLSQEAQKAMYKHTLISPPHPALQTREFLPYPDEVLSKKTRSTRVADDMVTIIVPLQAFWKNIWLEGGGEAR